MSTAAQISIHLPYLRRYARALTGSQATGDAYVRATLEAAIEDDELKAQISRGRTALYQVFSRIWQSGHVKLVDTGAGAGVASRDHERAVNDRLSAITPLHRQALLLTTVEDFSQADTAEILGVSVGDVESLIVQSVAEIDAETTADVLIIEDEPLISMQLDGLVSDLGHRVVGTAATHRQALEIFTRSPAGLVLADIQLADGSSGIDAVEDLLRLADVPVIFITAYPERLLTGERPEPTYLVTKPFREDTVRAAISQALFFGTSRPLD